jgi:hypothetical protein
VTNGRSVLLLCFSRAKFHFALYKPILELNTYGAFDGPEIIIHF